MKTIKNNQLFLKGAILAALSTSLLPKLSFAEAGGRDGHGGGVNVCGGQAELYDFFEGKRYNGLTIAPIQGFTVDQYVDQALEKLILSFSEYDQGLIRKDIDFYKDLLKGKMEYTTDTLSPTMDADKFEIPAGCMFQQAANWNERYDRLKFSVPLYGNDANLLGIMDNQNKAGLQVHEILYKIARVKGKQLNSDRVRVLVAELFSNKAKIDASVLGFKNLMIHTSYTCRPGTLERSTLPVSAEWRDFDRFTLCMTADEIKQSHARFDVSFQMSIPSAPLASDSINYSFVVKAWASDSDVSTSVLHVSNNRALYFDFKNVGLTDLKEMLIDLSGRSGSNPIEMKITITAAGSSVTSSPVVMQIIRSEDSDITRPFFIDILEKR